MKWTVPSGVTKVTFVAEGAQGGPSYEWLTKNVLFEGGYGGETSATFEVTTGEIFYLAVGGMGSGPLYEQEPDGIYAQGCEEGKGNPSAGGGFGGCGGGGSFVATQVKAEGFPSVILAAGGGGGAGTGGKGGDGGGIPGESGVALDGFGSGAGEGASETAPGKGGASQGKESPEGEPGSSKPTIYGSNGFEFSGGGSNPESENHPFAGEPVYLSGGQGGSGYYGGGGGAGCEEPETKCVPGGGGGGGGSAYAAPNTLGAPTGFDGGATGGGNGSVEVIYVFGESKEKGGSGGSDSSGSTGSGSSGSSGSGSSGSSGSGSSGSSGSGSATSPTLVKLPGNASVLSGSGKLTLSATCSGSSACEGTVRFEASANKGRAASTKKRGAATELYGSGKLSIAAGKSGKFQIILSKAARKLLAKKHRLTGTLLIGLKSGSKIVTTSSKLQVSLASKRKR